jgi:hypothetical protein
MSANDRERHLERLLGRRVCDRAGRPVGRIEEMRAEKENDYYVIAEIDLGPVALLERLSVRHLGFAWGGHPLGYRARWDQIDFEDEEHPRLVCDVSELQQIKTSRTR